VLNFIKIGQAVHVDLTVLKWPPSAILDFFKIQIFKRSERLTDPFCIVIPNFVKIGQTITEIWRFL